jgi:spore maturation protein CgeB
MRIFYASGVTPNTALSQSRIWYKNLYLALTDLGHEVVDFKFNLEPLIQNADFNNPIKRSFVDNNRPAAQEELLKQIRQASKEKPIDLFFSYFYSSCITKDTIQEIRSMGIVTINWYCNASYQFNLVSDIAPAYDYCLVPEKYRLDDYKRIGANPIYCQEAANPNIYKPFDVTKDHDVVFIGAKYADRALFIKEMHDAGINIRAYGPGWRRTNKKKSLREYLLLDYLHKLLWGIKRSRLRDRQKEIVLPLNATGFPLSDDELVKMYSRSKIVLGFSAVGSTHLEKQRISQIRLRDFEVPMSGGFYMVEYMKELEEFFEIDKEIVCYESPGDLVEKVKYFLAHDGERETIRRAGYLRAIKDHSWQKRFTDVFSQIGLN